MLARSGLVGKKSSWPHLGPSQAIFSMDQKIKNMYEIWLFSLVGQWALFTRFGVMCWCHFFPKQCALSWGSGSVSLVTQGLGEVAVGWAFVLSYRSL